MNSLKSIVIDTNTSIFNRLADLGDKNPTMMKVAKYVGGGASVLALGGFIALALFTSSFDGGLLAHSIKFGFLGINVGEAAKAALITTAMGGGLTANMGQWALKSSEIRKMINSIPIQMIDIPE